MMNFIVVMATVNTKYYPNL